MNVRIQKLNFIFINFAKFFSLAKDIFRPLVTTKMILKTEQFLNNGKFINGI